MKIPVSLLLILLSSTAIAQSRIGITASADYNSLYNKFEYSDNNSVFGMRPMLGNTFGINYSLQKKWYYHFEIGFYRTQFSDHSFMVRGGAGSYGAQSYMFTRTETKLFVPFNFLFNFNKGPSKLFASIGFMPMYDVNRKTEFIVSTGYNFERRDYLYNAPSIIDRLALGGQFSVGLSQSLSPSLELMVAPVFRTWVSTQTNFSRTNIQLPIAVGFNVGVYYKFNLKPKVAK